MYTRVPTQRRRISSGGDAHEGGHGFVDGDEAYPDAPVARM